MNALPPMDQKLLTPGRILFIPGSGLGIYCDTRETSVIGGETVQTALFLPLIKNNKANQPTHRTPVNQLEKKRVRRISTPEEMKEALSILTKKAKGMASIAYLLQEKQLKALMLDGSISALAQLLRDTMGAHRNEKGEVIGMGVSAKGDAADKAFDMMADELCFTANIPLSMAKQHLTDLLFRQATRKNPHDIWPFEGNTPRSDMLSVEELRKYTDGITDITVKTPQTPSTPKPKPQTSFISSPPDTTATSGPKSKPITRPRNSIFSARTRGKTGEARITPNKELAKLFTQLRPQIAGAPEKTFFNYAACQLTNPVTFAAMIYLRLVDKDKRLTLEQIAEKLKRNPQDLKQEILNDYQKITAQAEKDGKKAILNIALFGRGSGARANASSKKRRIQPNKELETTFSQLENEITRPPEKALFNYAACLLTNPVTFEAIARLRLVNRDNRLTLEQIAAQMEMDPDTLKQAVQDDYKKVMAQAEKNGKKYFLLISLFGRDSGARANTGSKKRHIQPNKELAEIFTQLRPQIAGTSEMGFFNYAARQLTNPVTFAAMVYLRLIDKDRRLSLEQIAEKLKRAPQDLKQEILNDYQKIIAQAEKDEKKYLSKISVFRRDSNRRQKFTDIVSLHPVEDGVEDNEAAVALLLDPDTLPKAGLHVSVILQKNEGGALVASIDGVKALRRRRSTEPKPHP